VLSFTLSQGVFFGRGEVQRRQQRVQILSMEHDKAETYVVEAVKRAEGQESYWARRTGGPVQRHFPPLPTAIITTEAPGYGQRYTAPPAFPPVSASLVAATPHIPVPPMTAADESDAPIPGKTHERRRNSIVSRITALAGGVVVPSGPRTRRQLRT
jgi:hypothetical protein